jgi:hypothetical protein
MRIWFAVSQQLKTTPKFSGAFANVLNWNTGKTDTFHRHFTRDKQVEISRETKETLNQKMNLSRNVEASGRLVSSVLTVRCDLKVSVKVVRSKL